MAQLNVEIPEDLHKRVKLIAVQRDMSVKILVVAALTELLEDLEAERAEVKSG